MTATLLPTNGEIREVFEQEVSPLGGRLTDALADGDRLFLRAVLSAEAQVRPGDHVSAGVALRTAGRHILVHPYTFRQVCRNGAIVAHTVSTRAVERPDLDATPWDVAESLERLGEAIRVCAAPGAFDAAMSEMRSTLETDADAVLNLLPHLLSMPGGADMLLREITRRFEASSGRSLFELMNAITATARDQRDPETRWRLEELGGAVAARVRPAPRPDGAAAVLFA